MPRGSLAEPVMKRRRNVISGERLGRRTLFMWKAAAGGGIVFARGRCVPVVAADAAAATTVVMTSMTVNEMKRFIYFPPSLLLPVLVESVTMVRWRSTK